MIPTGDGCCRCGMFFSFSFLVAVVTAVVVLLVDKVVASVDLFLEKGHF